MTAATSRIIQRALSAVGPWTTIATVTPSVTTYQDTGLTNDTEYFYRIIGVNAQGNSPPSNVASAIPSGAFDPDSIADLALWLDASDLTTIEFNGAQISGADNDDVSQWLDKSSGPAAYCGTGSLTSAAMKYRTSVNGHAGIQMGNIDRNYTRDASDNAIKVGTSQQITAFAVGATASSNATVVLFALTDDTSGNVYLNLSTSNPPGGFSINGTGASARESNTALTHFNFTTQDSNTGVRVATVRFGPVGGNVDIWRDGGDQRTIAAPATACFDTGGLNASALGEVNGLGQDPIFQSLTTWYEVLVYDRELTNQEVSDVHDYLKDKYGIT